MKKILTMALLLCASFTAQAVVISSDINPDGVDYTYFSISTAADVHLETLNGQFDPYMYLFLDDGSLDAADVIAFNDDGGTSALSFYNSLLNVSLTAGSYIVAIGDWYLSVDEAVLGIADNSFQSGTYDLLLTASAGTLTVNSVPEPSIIALLGLGLIGLGFRKKLQA